MPCIVSNLKKTVLFSSFGFLYLPEQIRVSFIRPDSPIPGDANVLIGSASDIDLCFQNVLPPAHTTVFSAGENKIFRTLSAQNRYNLVSLDMDIYEIFDALNEILSKQNTWEKVLNRCAMNNGTSHDLIKTAGLEIGCPIFVLDNSFRVLAFSAETLFPDHCIDKMLRSSVLERDTLPLFFDLSGQVSKTGTTFRTQSGNCCLAYNISTQENGSAYLLAFSQTLENELDIRLMLSALVRCINDYGFSRLFHTIPTKGVLSELLDTYMEASSLPLPEDINFLLMRLEEPVCKFFAILTIEFSASNRKIIPYELVMTRLQTIFPKQNMTVYQNDIVILYTTQQSRLKPDVDYNALGVLLEFYNARIGMSGMISNWYHIRTNYLLAKQTIMMSQVLRPDSNERVFSRWDFVMEITLYLCSRGYNDVYGHNDIIYIIHPAIARLAKYDAAHGTSLVDIFRQYMLNNCHATNTAKALYMHRNTFMLKLKKCYELFGEEIDVQANITSLMFSCAAVEYYTKYLRKDFNKFNTFSSYPLWSSDDIVH